MNAVEKLKLVKATLQDLGINFDMMTVADAYDVFQSIEKKMTWYQFMTACRTLSKS